jgi:hypothetical protein
MSKSIVHCLRTRPESVLLDFERLAHGAGLARHLDAAATTVLRDQQSLPFPMPGANTTPWQLEGAASALRGAGLEDLAVVHGRAAGDCLQDATMRRALRPIAERHGLRRVDAVDTDDVRWLEYRPRCTLRVFAKLFPEGVFVPSYFFGKNVVHLPTALAPTTRRPWGSLGSTLVGLLGPAHRLALHAGPHAIVDALAIERELHAGRFTFVDATTVVPERNGRYLDPITPNLVLASDDPVAIDATIARFFGVDPLTLPALVLAQDAGLGIADPRDIELEGDGGPSAPWTKPFAAEAPLAERLRERAGALLVGSAKPTPLADAVADVEERYLRGAFWQVSGKAMHARWRDTTEWGRLAEAYIAGETSRITGRPSVASVL